MCIRDRYWRGLMLAPTLSLNVFHTGCHSSLLSWPVIILMMTIFRWLLHWTSSVICCFFWDKNFFFVESTFGLISLMPCHSNVSTGHSSSSSCVLCWRLHLSPAVAYTYPTVRIFFFFVPSPFPVKMQLSPNIQFFSGKIYGWRDDRSRLSTMVLFVNL